ncbi:YeeE/YedE family protein [Aliiglaciecola litoralis]|uniref:YeeE/YedE family protein n=1 Tax=Aliiglaciecola litoralis TaxID=582857 RepID=A0ABP3X3Q0_9ALTE
MKNLVALVCGILFGAGLNISQMTDPQKVLNFLDLSGQWDPSLILVMGGALVVSALGFMISKKLRKPLLSDEFSIPNKSEITKPLIIGAVLFGFGWGLVGLCPGPAVASLAMPSIELIFFLVSMFLGMFIGKKLKTA